MRVGVKKTETHLDADDCIENLADMVIMHCVVVYSLFFVNPIPNSQSLGLETVNYYVYGNDLAESLMCTVYDITDHLYMRPLS